MKGFLKFLILLIIAASVAGSWFFSREVYTFYLKTYYIEWQKKDKKEMVRRGYSLVHEKKWDELDTYSGRLLLLFPDSCDALFMKGLSEIKRGYRDRGLPKIAAALADCTLSSSIINEAVELLFQDRYFPEIVALMKGRSSSSVDVLYYYGRALFEAGDYASSACQLQKAIKGGRIDSEIYYYYARALTETGDLTGALKYMEFAADLNRSDRAIARELADLYRRLGKIEKAEKIIRKQKK